MRKKKPNNDLLTSVELEMMTVLWSLGQATVREIVDHESHDVKRAYTSVATVMKILEQKNFVISAKSDRSLLFRPLVSKEVYQGRSLQNISKTLFEDTPSALVARLVDDENLTEDMLEEMQEMLAQRLGKK
ncbi:transcriptional regulator [Amylibacter marinus]|uniref:Transcriptional regulator n=1 Tax=Amylibacter marinus TaxID=1475483 RepID=A0ABQ5VYD1_9RHOB|nr:BlaI/MecI/CopY family transcriptional regulator [Amylibacter marinus]GLQ36294.1 transcriptional regulator [Amylibacter marinus]